MGNKVNPIQYYSSQRTGEKLGGDEAPPMPHLAVRVNESTIAPIPPGVHMFIVKDPSKINGVFELIFEKVKFKDDAPTEIHFIVPQQGGNRKCVATLTWAGLYKDWMAAHPEESPEDAAAAVQEQIQTEEVKMRVKNTLNDWKRKQGLKVK